MTNRIHILFTAAASLLLATGLANGQPRVRVTIPFAFEAQQKALPAGNYDMTVLRSSSSSVLVRLQSASMKDAVLMTPRSETAKGDSRTATFTFTCGGDCQLRGLRVGQRAYLWPVRKSRAHQEVAVIQGTLISGQ